MMTRANASDAALSSISPLTIRTYVIARGWDRVESYGNMGDVYSLSDEPTEIIVPASTQFADYGPRLRELIGILADTQDTTVRAIINDLLKTDVDLIRIRLPSTADDGSIPIEAGVLVVSQAREMLLAAACSASRPQPTFRAGRIRDANEYMAGVRLGQTEMGSFVVNLLSPVPPLLQPSMIASSQPEPYARRVVAKLASGLRVIRNAIDLANRTGELIGFRKGVEDGVSANLCTSLGGMLSEGGQEGMQISISWSLTRPNAIGPSRVWFGSTDSPVLEEASRQLRDRDARPDEVLYGFVTTMARLESESIGRVTIRSILDDRITSVRVDLRPEDYARAADAHESRMMVSLEGDLTRDGHRWILTNPRNLVTYSDDDYQPRTGFTESW